MVALHTCPCCGHLVFDEAPGSYELCPICYWEDSAVQLYYPSEAGGGNDVCLIEAQVNFFQFGACERRLAPHVRAVTTEDEKDARWFPLWQRKILLPEIDERNRPPDDLRQLYYWRREPL